MTLTLKDLLERLGYTPAESHQLCTKKPGGTFQATTRTEPTRIDTTVDTWFGPNPVQPVTSGRPDADQITRLAALWADIDIDPSKCPDHGTAIAIVDDLSAMLGSEPIAITFSGHGRQPIWAIENGHIGAWPRSDARALLRRWGRLVIAVAGRRGAKVDSVWDLPRILRCPDSINHKNPLEPQRVICAPAGGTPLSIARILEVLNENDIPDHEDDHRDPGAIISAPDQWAYVNGTCHYAQTMINGWANDNPTARHPWLLSQATRVAAAHRHACLSPRGHTVALNTLTTRFQQLLANGFINREPSPGEIQDAIAWGQARAAAMTDRDVLLELGTHTHWAEPQLKGTDYGPLRDVSAPTPHVGTTHQSRENSDTNPVLDGATPQGAVNSDATVRNVPVRVATPPQVVTPNLEPLLPDTSTPTATTAAGQPLVDPWAQEAFDKELTRQVAQQAVRAHLKAQRAPSIEDLDAKYLTVEQLRNLPAADPLIDGIINRNNYIILRGRDGTYKTFAALDWALSVATGHQWHNRPTQRCKVLYVLGEGLHGTSSRIDAWMTAWNQHDASWFTLRSEAINLFAGGTELDDLIRRVEEGKYGLVVIDTLRRASGGADGNSSDMGVVVDNIDRVKRATAGGSVLVISHTDKGDNDSRGYSGIEDDADIVWHAKREDDSNNVDLVNTKMKDGPDGEKIELEVQQCLGSIVLQIRNGGESDTEHDADKRVLAALNDMFTTTGATVGQLVEVTELSPSGVYKARGRLEKAGQIDVIPRGVGHVIKINKRGIGRGIDTPIPRGVWNPDSTPS